MTPARNWLQAHAVIGYFGLASWSAGWSPSSALAAQHVLPALLPMWLHYLASLGPITAALVVTAATDGRSGIAELVARITRWRIGWRWWVVAAGSPVGLFALAAAVARLAEGTWPSLGRVGDVNFLGDVGAPAALVLWIVTFGFGEETGWRGFALARLQRRHSTLVVGALCAGSSPRVSCICSANCSAGPAPSRTHSRCSGSPLPSRPSSP